MMDQKHSFIQRVSFTFSNRRQPPQTLALTMQCPHNYKPRLSADGYLSFPKSSNLKSHLFAAKFRHKNPVHNYNIDDDGSVKYSLPPNVQAITSTANPFVKHCLKLRHSPSYRHSHGCALVVGTTPIREIHWYQESSQEKNVAIDCLLLLDGADIPEWLEDKVRVVRVSFLVMKKISGIQSAESTEATALMRIPTSFLNLNAEDESACHSWFQFTHRVLVLDGIQDPGNLGTLLRSAMAFGWGGVFLLPGCCDPFNEKALRASQGAAFQIPIVSGSWCHLRNFAHKFQMRMLAGHPKGNEKSKHVFSLSDSFADSLADVPVCLILGSEGQGISEESLRECGLVFIPMSGKFESLNVSVAGGILLYMLQPKDRQQCNNLPHNDV